jgi:hypothetical protein
LRGENLSEVLVRPVHPPEEHRFQQLIQEHHYLGALPKISETLRYVATFGNQWVALLSFSAAALKCSARDRWIGWDFRHQYDRLKLVTNNSRFLILPDWHFPNLASRILSLCQKRLPADRQTVFDHPIVLLETFVDPQCFRGTIYKAANWIYVGNTKGFHRTRQGYSATAYSPKMVFVKPLISDAQALFPNLFSIQLIVQEVQKSCSVQNTWNPYPIFLKKSQIRAVPKDDAIDSPRS